MGCKKSVNRFLSHHFVPSWLVEGILNCTRIPFLRDRGPLFARFFASILDERLLRWSITPANENGYFDLELPRIIHDDIFFRITFFRSSLRERCLRQRKRKKKKKKKKKGAYNIFYLRVIFDGIASLGGFKR